MVDREPALNDLLAALTSTRPEPATSVLRAAFVGRTSTEDSQDPTLSIPRQVSTCHAKLKSLPIQVAIVAYYWDIETGRVDLDLRGQSDAYQRFNVPTPRDGGITDLLTAAASPEPGFDVVIAEQIARTARDTRASIEFEYQLTQHNIQLWCADEPIDHTTTHATATNTLLRGVNRAIADWYVRNLLEQSRGGTIEHVKAGYNIGRAPYGYLAHRIPHPVPAKRARGQSKTILTVDPRTAPIIATIFTWRTTEHLGYQRITDRLNDNRVQYPAPNGQTWSTSTIRHILNNPKYTGYQVYNRTRMKTAHHPSKTNPPHEWIWSPQPAHPAIITIEQFTTAQAIATTTERSRSDRYPGAPNPHPQTKNIYKLRSYITCTHCGRRLFGRTDGPTRVYYICQPPKTKRPQGHPPTITLPEHQLLAAINNYFNTHIIGPVRQDLLHDVRQTVTNQDDKNRQQQIEALTHEIDRLQSGQERLIRNLQIFDFDTDRTTIEHIKQQLRDLDSRHHAASTQLTTLTNSEQPTRNGNTKFHEVLPDEDIDLAQLPAPLLRKLLDAYHFTATYNHHNHHVHMRFLTSKTDNERLTSS